MFVGNILREDQFWALPMGLFSLFGYICTLMAAFVPALRFYMGMVSFREHPVELAAQRFGRIWRSMWTLPPMTSMEALFIPGTCDFVPANYSFLQIIDNISCIVSKLSMMGLIGDLSF